MSHYGEIRGVAHNECNINYTIPTFVPVNFHFLSNYNGHLLIKKFGGFNNEEIKCIPSNEENIFRLAGGLIVDTYIKNGKRRL